MRTITTRYLGDMRFRAVLGDHVVTVDVPPDMGGRNRGPTPAELFVVSLGACVAAFVARHCERQGLDDRDLAVDVRYDRADDSARLVELAIVVRLPHAECAGCEEALRMVVEQCPVPATLATLEGASIVILDHPALVA